MARSLRGHEATRTTRSREGGPSAASFSAWRRRIPTVASGKAVTIWWGILSAFVLFVCGEAPAETPGRYIQSNREAKNGAFTLRVDSIDVLQDRSMQVNLIITNNDEIPQAIIITDPSKIQLVSDSLERVSAAGKLEGQRVYGQGSSIQLLPSGSIRMPLQFPAFRKETKTVKLVFYPGVAIRRWAHADFVLIMLGFLLQWPTLLTFLMFPVLVYMYIRLAGREEREVLAEFGDAYARYAATIPAFFPRFGRRFQQAERQNHPERMRDSANSDASCW